MIRFPIVPEGRTDTGLRKGLLLLIAGILVGCTSDLSTPRTPLPDPQAPAAAGQIGIVFQETALQLLRMKQDLKQMRGTVDPGAVVVPFLQAAIDRLELTILNLGEFVRYPFAPLQTPVPGWTGTGVFTASVEVADGVGFFDTALVQDAGDRLEIEIRFISAVDKSFGKNEEYREFAGTLNKNSLAGTMRHFIFTPTGAGPPDAEWEWSYDPAGTSTLRIADGGPQAGGKYAWLFVLTYNRDFTGQGTVTLLDGTTSSVTWP